jgi:L-serine dehydratase
MKYNSIFDILGRIMVGPSSSHTAGACQIGYIANRLMGGVPDSVQIFLHGSFAETWRGHGTDVAILAGLLGMQPDDPRIPNAHELAKQQNMRYEFENADLGNDFHPNSVKLVLKKGEKQLSLVGSSIGGGNIRIVEINGIEAGFSGKRPMIIIINEDKVGVLSKITTAISHHNVNIISMKLTRKDKEKIALGWIEISAKASQDLIEEIMKIKEVKEVITLDV